MKQPVGSGPEKGANEMVRYDTLLIDASTICQLRCPGCPNTDNPDAVYGIGYLRYSNFKKLIDSNKFRAVSFSNMGEFFLNPDLADIFKYSHEKKLMMSANASNFSSISCSSSSTNVGATFNKRNFRFFCNNSMRLRIARRLRNKRSSIMPEKPEIIPSTTIKLPDRDNHSLSKK